MKVWRVRLLYFLALNAAVQHVTSLEEKRTGSIFAHPLVELSQLTVPRALKLAQIIADNLLDPLTELFEHKDAGDQPAAKFSLRKASRPDDDLCYIVPGKPDSLAACTFNSTSKTFLVIHGWTLSGMFESWVTKLVSALYAREETANVVVVDWLASAQNHYAVAAQNTREVGREVARFIDWIEETTNMPLENLHLIGYSLGAHVAGFAGSHATNKVGRITGLDPAGPDFEGKHAHRRLSPDDARFVDVLHTFTRRSLGLSIGIRQPVGHIDIYPNGGNFQPGCNLRGALEKIANLGIFAVTDAVKCEHERSVHLFIDSLLNERETAVAYRCGSSDMFDRGVCLCCRKRRCNAVGYGVSRVRQAGSVQMYTRTRASMPFRVYHYQLKIHFSGQVKRSEMEPSLTVSLHGTKGEAEDLELRLKEKIATNKTHSFLLVTEKDIGDLLMLKFRWEETNGWSASNMLKMVSSWWSGDSDSNDMEVHKIRIRAGETQQKMVFCVKDNEAQKFQQEVTFVKCKGAWRRNQRRTLKRK
uniref:triacylglycerol lipase n=1 Tax=Gasterosteus aculeatus aculeatus TaxID=481459 RepID=G3PBM6_GASAC